MPDRRAKFALHRMHPGLSRLTAIMACWYFTQSAALVFAPDRMVTGGIYESLGYLAPGDTALSMRFIGAGFGAVGTLLAGAVVTRDRDGWLLRVAWSASFMVSTVWTFVFVVGTALGWSRAVTGAATYFWLYWAVHIPALREPLHNPASWRPE